jgi:hypothetical protein
VSSAIEQIFEALEVIIYLYRLSVAASNYPEARYFVKQLFQLAENSKSVIIKDVADRIKSELAILNGTHGPRVDYVSCESILKSNRFKPFTHSYNVFSARCHSFLLCFVDFSKIRFHENTYY